MIFVGADYQAATSLGGITASNVEFVTALVRVCCVLLDLCCLTRAAGACLVTVAPVCLVLAGEAMQGRERERGKVLRIVLFGFAKLVAFHWSDSCF